MPMCMSMSLMRMLMSMYVLMCMLTFMLMLMVRLMILAAGCVKYVLAHGQACLSHRVPTLAAKGFSLFLDV